VVIAITLLVLISLIAIIIFAFKFESKQNELRINYQENDLVATVFSRWKDLVKENNGEIIDCYFRNEYRCGALVSEYIDDSSESLFYFYTKLFSDSLHHIRSMFPPQFKLLPEWESLIEKNKTDLRTQRGSLMKHGRYGQVDNSQWISEQNLFIDKIIDIDKYLVDITSKYLHSENNVYEKVPISTYKDQSDSAFLHKFLDSQLAWKARTFFKNTWIPSEEFTILVSDIIRINLCIVISSYIDSILDGALDECVTAPDALASFNGSPYDYEGLCASMLNENGWVAHATKKSGDQGADVYAEKNGISVVLQCKLTNSTVGNKAVQEIISGQKFMSADYAAVVTPGKYTPGAQDIARAAKVLLLHHEDLPHLESLCKRVLS
jgi:hypothetical protein